MNNIPQSKRCTICKESFPPTPEFFFRNKNKKDGLGTECKTCDSIRRKAHSETHKEHEIQQKKLYREIHKEEIFEKKKLHRETHKEQIAAKKKQWQQGESYKSYQQRYQKEHKEDIAIQRRQYYLAHREETCERQRQYLQTERGKMVDKAHRWKRKAQKRAFEGSYTSQELQEQLKRQKSKCYYCKIKLSKEYHADHIVPLSRGGTNRIDNIVLTCPPCNLSKKAKLPHEWGEGGRLL